MNSEQITQLIPEKYRPFFLIESDLISQAPIVQQSIQAFVEAVKLLFQFVAPTKVVTAIFSGRELTINIPGIQLRHTLIAPTLHLTLNHHTLYLDVASAILHRYEEQVACYLEELVHAFMNTKDEPLTHHIVEMLYPKVKFDGSTFKALA